MDAVELVLRVPRAYAQLRLRSTLPGRSARRLPARGSYWAQFGDQSYKERFRDPAEAQHVLGRPYRYAFAER